MPRSKKAKSANSAGTIRYRSDGRYEARVTTGFDEDGRQLRKSVYGRTNAQVRAKMIKLQGQVQKGTPIPRGRIPTFADYAERWLGQLARRQSTVRRYGELLKVHINPAVGRLQLTKIERSDVIAMMRRVQDAGAERHRQSGKGSAPQHPQRGGPRRSRLPKRRSAGAAASDLRCHSRKATPAGTTSRPSPSCRPASQMVRFGSSCLVPAAESGGPRAHLGDGRR